MKTVRAAAMTLCKGTSRIFNCSKFILKEFKEVPLDDAEDVGEKKDVEPDDPPEDVPETELLTPAAIPAVIALAAPTFTLIAVLLADCDEPPSPRNLPGLLITPRVSPPPLTHLHH